MTNPTSRDSNREPPENGLDSVSSSGPNGEPAGLAQAPPLIADQLTVDMPHANIAHVRSLARGIAAIVAPSSLITALLYYFGAVYIKAKIEYFGVDASALELSTTDYLLASLRPVFTPLASVLILSLAALTLQARISIWISSQDDAKVRRVSRLLVVLAGPFLLLGVIGMARPELAPADLLFTPICLGLGTILASYGCI